MLTTVENKPLSLAVFPRRQYLVSVDPMNKTALNVAHTLWTMLPGTVRIIPQGMVYFAGLEPVHLDMFSTKIVLDDTRPAKTFHVGSPLMPQTVVEADGTKTVFPPDPTVTVVASLSQALDVVADEREAAWKERANSEDLALKQKIAYYLGVVTIFALAITLAWWLS